MSAAAACATWNCVVYSLEIRLVNPSAASRHSQQPPAVLFTLHACRVCECKQQPTYVRGHHTHTRGSHATLRSPCARVALQLSLCTRHQTSRAVFCCSTHGLCELTTTTYRRQTEAVGFRIEVFVCWFDVEPLFPTSLSGFTEYPPHSAR